MPAGAHKRFDAESLLQSLMHNVPGAIYRCVWDDVWKMQRVSKEIESISGYPPSDFVDASKRTLVSVTHPDDREAVDRTIRAAIASGRPYARASRATVQIRRDGDAVLVEVGDDGCGGADRARGSGLHGLSDRLGAVNGALELESPPGGGTRLRARVPLNGAA